MTSSLTVGTGAILIYLFLVQGQVWLVSTVSVAWRKVCVILPLET